jgi:hypothetical protein
MFISLYLAETGHAGCGAFATTLSLPGLIKAKLNFEGSLAESSPSFVQ